MYSFLDLETTGLDWTDGHRIIEFAAEMWNVEKGATTSGKSIRTCKGEMSFRINPARSVPIIITRITGLTLADVMGEKLYHERAPIIDELLRRTDVLVAHNGEGFDFPFLRYEQNRCGFGSFPALTFDTAKSGRFATYDGKMPRLQELCFSLGVEYDPTQAHRAGYDTDVLAKAFFEGQDRGVFPTFEC